MTHLLSKILKWGELAGIIVTIAAVILKKIGAPMASEILMIALLALATVFFLSGFVAPPLNTGESKMLVTDLIAGKLQKLIYIGISVLCVGYVFAILHLSGANEMMLIGLFTLFGCITVSIILILTKKESLTLLKSALLRSIIMLGFYFLTPYLK